MSEKSSKKEKILETRASEAILKAIGKDVKEEMDTLSADQLKNVVVGSLESMSEAAEQLAGNPQYQDLSRRLTDVTQGLKEVNKYQKGKIAYARQRLREMGKVEDKYALENQLIDDRDALRDKRFKAVAKGELKPRCTKCGVESRNVAGPSETPVFECLRCETLPRSQGVAV